MMLLTFVTGFLGLSPNVIPAPPTGTAGPFSTTTFLGPLTAFLPNMIIITMLIYCECPSKIQYCPSTALSNSQESATSKHDLQ